MPSARRPALVLLAALALVVSGCGEDDPTVVGSAPSGPATTTTGAPTTTTSIAGGAPFATTNVSTPPAQAGLLARVTATADGDVDRVTFEFEGAVPGYRIGFAERPIVEDGSGEEVTVDGQAVLLVHFEPASGFDLSGEGRQVYTGPRRLDLATRTVLDVVRASDFEANLEWVIGLDASAPFRVRTESKPGRVVVEVRVNQ